MEVRRVKHFIAVAAYGSFQRTAKALHISQPALSLSIKALEGELGVRLFDRLQNRVVLTSAGTLLLRHAEEVLHQIDILEKAARTLTSPPVGLVSIGLGISLAPSTVGTFLRRISDKLPNVVLRVRTGLFANLVNGLRDDSLEFLVTRLDGSSRTADLEQTEWFHDRQVIVCSRQHPLASLESVNVSDFARYPWVSSGPLENTLENWVEFFVESGAKPPLVKVQIDEFPSIISLISNSEFLSVFPQNYAQDPTLREVLSIVHPGVPQWSRPFGCTIRRGRTLSADATATMKLLREIIDEEIRSNSIYGSPLRIFASR